ncbi:hypothetical protein JR316_0012094 [Psilocybe cubensis]|uniref:Uncharacterized protein n=1 Tax=Psilocybe cubensis TaxID=181762 RepID=A0ACB8GIV4_PSICU|nr:hypothetical protein JR316_0012094 [Psilocybe cubensis]KAH9474995.1 hypothetical protein JR316_0012094 [Psilocybe cubensis]
MGQLSLEKTFLLATFIESMIVISAFMFFMATFHLSMNGYRLLRGYADNRLSPGGPVGYIGNLKLWDHILKDTIYATQENLGSAAAIYRAWVLWNFDYRVILLPVVLLLVNIGTHNGSAFFECAMLFTLQLGAGYVVCGTYSSVDPTATVFLPRLTQWIKTFYSVAVVLNIITTALMGWRIYITHKRSANYNVGQGRLLSILRILVESAALQLIIEIVLLALYCSNIDAQYILLESAITFNSITVRIKLQSAAENMKTMQTSNGHTHNPVQTIGSIPMKRIHVNIDREVDDDGGYGSSVFKDKP